MTDATEPRPTDGASDPLRESIEAHVRRASKVGAIG